jgi:hypothetical protein
MSFQSIQDDASVQPPMQNLGTDKAPKKWRRKSPVPTWVGRFGPALAIVKWRQAQFRSFVDRTRRNPHALAKKPTACASTNQPVGCGDCVIFKHWPEA